MRFLAENARWLAAGFLLTFMSAFGQTYFIALFGGEIRAELDLTHGEFGTIYGAATLASAVALIWVGKLADHDATRRIAVLVCGMLALATLGMAFVRGTFMLLLVIFGLRLFGQGMCTHVSQTAMGRWFVARRGKALAISGFGFPTSEAILPPLIVLLLVMVGWRTAWIGAAGVLVLIAIPVLAVLLRTDRTPQSTFADLADGDGVAQRQWTRPEVIRDPLFYLIMLGVLTPAFIGTGIFFHSVHLVETKGWPLTLFAERFPLYAAVSVATSFLAGSAVDKWSARHVLPFTILPMGFSVMALSLGTAPVTMTVYMALTGMTAGFHSTTFAALWPEVYGTRHLGAIRALTMSAMVFGSAASPYVLGTLIDFGIPFDRQLFVMAVYIFVATLVLIPCSRLLLARAPAGMEGAQSMERI